MFLWLSQLGFSLDKKILYQNQERIEPKTTLVPLFRPLLIFGDANDAQPYFLHVFYFGYFFSIWRKCVSKIDFWLSSHWDNKTPRVVNQNFQPRVKNEQRFFRGNSDFMKRSLHNKRAFNWKAFQKCLFIEEEMNILNVSFSITTWTLWT